ncbi:MAG: archease [Candidatus Calescibacterium sp.]|nr:archease [Candidatus Calescibacterium sp.]MCX7971970.1 archease [bacterium]MDW8195444.1 archease [Candidatus Calescibacterium sp.]
MTYIFEDHTADIMIVIKSESLLDFFNDILAALWEIFLMKNEDFKLEEQSNEKETLEFEINFEKPEELVFNFINRYIYFGEVNKKIIRLVKEIKKFENRIVFYSEVVKVGKIVSYIKSPTYHNFEVDLDKCYCRVVIDV